ncbi:MAG: TRAP transporter large permease subunit, partial [Rhodoblastus sp.]|nr:TRAP transporter large permease subunit [Rhodoblastus sp.]
PKDQLPSARKALMARWPLLLPLVVLVYLLFAGYTPLFAGALSLTLTVVIILGMPLSTRLPAGVLRSLFWIALGILCSVFFAKEFTVFGFRIQGVELVLLIVLA